MSTHHVLLNLIGPSTHLQARVFTSPNVFTELSHFEEELLKENGFPRDLLKNRTETKVLPHGGGGLHLITFSSKN